MARVLIVEDEEHLATGIHFNLEAEGYEAEVVKDGADALTALASGVYDLVLLDAMLPGIDGFQVAQSMRESGNRTPILMLTAKSLPEDVVHGLESGADDYLPKPFELAVLLARIKSLLRRRDWTREGTAEGATMRIGRADVDFAALEVRVGEKVSRLTLLEAALLKLLVRNAGRVVSKGEILERVWNVRADTDTRAVENFIVRLRRHVEEDASAPRVLLTVRGIGYRLALGPPEDGKS
jgi:DNA-binding response OmpR family regulator